MAPCNRERWGAGARLFRAACGMTSFAGIRPVSPAPVPAQPGLPPRGFFSSLVSAVARERLSGRSLNGHGEMQIAAAFGAARANTADAKREIIGAVIAGNRRVVIMTALL